LHNEGVWRLVDRSWEDVVNDDSLDALWVSTGDATRSQSELADAAAHALPPIGERQELWAAGVTYLRSRTARMEESETAGGGDFYDRVYVADRPELFLKATAHRVVGPDDALHRRSDSQWIVPEPELVLVATRRGRIVGYTIGNDLSCRDIEGENPLYLPQAKTFDRCAALGPAILVSSTPPPAAAAVRLVVRRNGQPVVEGSTTLSQMKRSHGELVGYLFQDNAHPFGCLLMTGTGVVPPDDFSLQAGDAIEISIDGIGTLINTVD
jgi:2-dehydro-3-deoxy-D-arabinonate dehydratase